MSSNSQARAQLVMVNDTGLTYDWFGALDYSWFDNSGSLGSVPFFDAVPEELAHMAEKSSARQQLRLTLGPRDCMTTSGSRNCTDACSDPSALFAPENLRACTALAGAALLVQNEMYTVDRSDAQTIEVMDSWRVPELSTYNATAVFTHLSGCISESCTVVSKLGECPDDLRTLAGTEVKADSLGNISSRLAHYCENLNVAISPDLAGPGVLLSYFFQTSLAFFLYFLLRGSTTCARRLDTLFKRRGKEDGSPSRGKLATLPSKLTGSGLGATATTSLVEFQEMQIYFIGAVQVATLISFNPSTTESTGVNNNSYAAMLHNSGLAGLLATSSMAGVLLVQCSLQRTRMHWWYTFILTTYTLVFAFVIFTRRSRLMPRADTLWQNFRDGTLLPRCGNNPSPMTYCKPPRGTRFLDNDIAGVAICCLGAVAWAGLFVDQLASSIPERFPAVAQRLGGLIPKDKLRRKSKLLTSMSAAYWIIVEGLLLLMTGYHLSQLVLVLDGVDISDGSNWSFGQLIAISVWAPTIAKFIYSNVFGVKGSFEPRLPRNYSIIREGDAEEADGDHPRSDQSQNHTIA